MPSINGNIDELTSVVLLPNASRTANVAATGVDMLGFKGTVRIVQNAGDTTAGDNNSTFTCYLQHSHDSNTSNYTNASVTLTAATNVASVVTYDVPMRDTRRYWRIIGNIAGGNNPAFPIGVTATGFKTTS